MTGSTRIARAEQLDVWLAASQDTESPRYNVPIALDFDARLDEAAIRTALRQLFDRHPALRSSFRTDASGQLRQTIAGTFEPPLRVVRSAAKLDQPARAAWAAEAGLRPLALDSVGMGRADLLMHRDGAVLVLTVHHIVLDGWSVEVLLEELLALYDAALSNSLSVQVPATAETMEAGETADSGTVGYWLNLLDPGIEVLQPIPDFVRGVRPSRAEREELLIEGDGLAIVRAHVEQARVSMSIACLAAWSAVLHQWSGLTEGLLAMPFSARLDPDTHRTVDLLSRVLPVRSAFDPAISWTAHLGSVQAQVLQSFEHSTVSTAALRTAVAAQGRRYPAYRAIYTHVTEPRVLQVLPATAVSRIDIDLGAVKYDLSAAVIEGSDGLRLQLEYDAAVYRGSTARTMLAQLHGLLLAAAANPDAALDDLLRAADGSAGLAATSGDQTAEASAVPPQLVVEVARSASGRIAVVHGAQQLTYAELVASASRLAHWLLAETGTEPDQMVGVLLPAGIDAVVAFLGVTLAGKAYVPMEPDNPSARLATIVEDSGIRRILTSPQLASRAASLGCAAHTVEDVRTAAAGYGAEPPSLALTPDTLFNVLYTSGSTGRPKGVMLSHRGVARLMRNGGYLQLDENDRVAHLSPLNFDGATYEIWGALTHGARLVILDRPLALSPAELREAVREHGVTALIVTTPVFHNVVAEAPDLLQSLNLICLGGDVASIPHVSRALTWCGPGVLVNSYGPTENSFTSLLTGVDQVEEGSRTLPIGRCVAGTEAYVVRDGTYELAPVGAPGELLLGGEGLADGYLGDPRRTAASFVPDPFSGRPGRRLYRTGDRVRRLPGGELEFIGRADDQVKIRSQRIELGEVRSALLADTTVREGYVTSWSNARGEKEIAAYVVLVPVTSLGHVRDRLASVLTPAAVPTRWAELDTLPLNANGKVDPNRLPAPALLDPGGVATTPGAASRTAVTPGRLEVVRAAWCEVLDASPADDNVNFFDAGGHSLLLARLQSALQRHAGVEIRVADLLRFPSIRAQAELLTAASGEEPPVSGVTGTFEGGVPIAIIGAACRFPGTQDVRAFWRNLARDCVARTDAGVVDLGGGRRRIDRWGILDDPRAFDAELFGMTPAEARITDPQHGLLHECLWSAMEDAALTLNRLRDRTSIYAGCANLDVPAGPANGSPGESASAAFASQPSFAATRYAYRHDLRGESVMVDTACSTSLVAVHLACSSLRTGSSDYAFAGGVSVIDPASGGYIYEPGMLYAEDGVCRPFDEAATGTVGGDGAGVVLLRRLSDALRDGDPIHAVIVGSAVNNDGHARAGYAAPGAAGQIRVIGHALEAARVKGNDVGFVETHGTGTRLGDAVEAVALAEAIGERDVPLPISSVKSAIGHCNTAAGVAGLLKAVHAVRDHILPGTVNSENPIEEIAVGERLRLLTQTEKWPDDGRARLAGVSSFGVGGTNAHVLLREFTPQEAGAGR